MHQSDAIFREDDHGGESIQPIAMGGGDLLARPIDRISSVRAEIFQAQLVQYSQIMIPGQPDPRIRAEAFDTGVRLRPVADDVSQTPNPVESASVLEDGSECDQIGVNV